MGSLEKIVVVTRATPLEELVRRFNTEGQARFVIEQAGGSFEGIRVAHDIFQRSRDALARALPRGVHVQWVDRSFLPTFLFGPQDVVVTLGPDGLVVNTAKYLMGQPVIAFNPDPSRIDGVLLPFAVGATASAFEEFERGALGETAITMARATLSDGQSLHAVNDLFVGQRTHVSARYRIRQGAMAEDQSSSGLIVSTGAGSTGWFRSILTGAAAVAGAFAPSTRVEAVRDRYAFGWSETRLAYSVREPFTSRTSAAGLVFGWITPGEPLELDSYMAGGGVIFGDGVEEDFLQFNSGTRATIGISDRTLRLMRPAGS